MAAGMGASLGKKVHVDGCTEELLRFNVMELRRNLKKIRVGESGFVRTKGGMVSTYLSGFSGVGEAEEVLS